jgi:Flp pilus assembly protein TadG
MMCIRPLRGCFRSGAVAVQVALAMTALMGLLAIVVDGGLLLAERRQLQAVADSAALAYAAAKETGATDATAQSSALAIASANGATNDGTTSLITPSSVDGSGNPQHGIWNTPTSGPFKGQTGYVEVVVQYDQARLFSTFWATTTLPVRARAVASWGGSVNYWGASILTLATSGTGLQDSSSAITVPGSILDDSGISVSGSGKITSTGGQIDVVGTVKGSAYSPAPTTVTTTTSDPLASLALPDPSSLTVRSTSQLKIGSGTVNLQPGVYQGGISINGGTVNLASGIYYLEGGGMTIQGNNTKVTDNGAGVLFYNGETGGATNNPSSVGSIQLKSGADVEISPMSTGTWQGINIFQDRSATAAMTLSGGGNTYIKGMVYAPDSDATISGGSTIVPGTSFITKTLTISGGSAFTIPLATVKVPIPGSNFGGVTLVE